MEFCRVALLLRFHGGLELCEPQPRHIGPKRRNPVRDADAGQLSSRWWWWWCRGSRGCWWWTHPGEPLKFPPIGSKSTGSRLPRDCTLSLNCLLFVHFTTLPYFASPQPVPLDHVGVTNVGTLGMWLEKVINESIESNIKSIYRSKVTLQWRFLLYIDTQVYAMTRRRRLAARPHARGTLQFASFALYCSSYIPPPFNNFK